MIKASQEFVPVFIDTLKDLKTTKRFKEKYGSYPVLRVHNVKGKDIAGRLDGNLVAGQIPAFQVLKQMQYAKTVLQRQAMLDQRNARMRGQTRGSGQNPTAKNTAEESSSKSKETSGSKKR